MDEAHGSWGALPCREIPILPGNGRESWGWELGRSLGEAPLRVSGADVLQNLDWSHFLSRTQFPTCWMGLYNLFVRGVGRIELENRHSRVE